MGLFDIFKKTENEKPVQPEKQADQAAVPEKGKDDESKGYLGDLEKTQRIEMMCNVPHEQRDQQWVNQLLADLPLASFRCGTPQIIAGPDGFPYFQLLLPEHGQEFQCFVFDRMVDDFLVKRGYGIVLNAEKGQPDWVLSYGDVLNYKLNGEFFTQDSPFQASKEDETLLKDEKIMVGQPSETILPKTTRKLLREFFELNGIENPKILLMMRSKGDIVSQELAFNLTPARFENETQFRNMMQTVTWYLPRHYSVVGLNEDAVEDGFMPL